MKKQNNRVRRLLAQAADRPGIPHTLNRDIVHIAQRHLKAAGHGLYPQQRDVKWAVDMAWREWSRRFLNALDARSAPPGDAPSANPA